MEQEAACRVSSQLSKARKRWAYESIVGTPALIRWTGRRFGLPRSCIGQQHRQKYRRQRLSLRESRCRRFPGSGELNAFQRLITAVQANIRSFQGFTWGSSPSPLLEAIGSTPEQQRKFDLVLLSDLVFNHSQHGALLDSCEALLADADRQATTEPPRPSAVSLPDCDLSPPAFTTPAVLCFFSHHRPTEELIKADMGILTMAKARGWRVTRVWKDEGAGVSFRPSRV